MLNFILSTLLDYTSTGQEPDLSSVVVDSRKVVAGSLFVAFVGEKQDGHDYVADAFRRGAAAALTERPLPGHHQTIDTRPGAVQNQLAATRQVCIIVEDSMIALQNIAKAWRAKSSARAIGITGSIGKTTSKELTHAVLSQRFNSLKTSGNRNNEIGLPLTLLELRPAHERMVLEMGMYTPGEIARLCEIAKPQIGVVTNVGPVHLERAGSIDAILSAKRELVESLPEDGVAILNRDDARVMSMADHTKARIFTYGLDNQADLWADNIHSMGLSGLRFTLHHRDESLSVSVPLIGRHSVHTALRATAVALVEGLSWTEIVAGLSQTSAGQLRLVAVPGPNGSILIDDTYNSSPDSALAALNLLADLDGRRIAVLGDMLELGAVEQASHRLVGRRAADVADILVTIGTRAAEIASEAKYVGMSPDRVHWVAETPAAIPLLEQMIKEKDIVLIKGSLGMGMERIVSALGRAK